MAISLYAGIFLLLLNQKISDKITGYKNKLEKKIIIMGLGLYFLLLPIAFMFTHYAIVGGNYQFMQGILTYNSKLIDIYDKRKQTDNFDIKDLKWFDSMESAISFYSDPTFQSRVATSKSKDEFYKLSLQDLKEIKQNGFPNLEKLNYDKMKRFHDWIQIFYNFSFRGSAQNSFWFTEISPVLNPYRVNDQDTLRHSALLVKKSASQGYYILLDFNRVLRDLHLVYLFNTIFIIFNIVYFLLFWYVIKIHLKLGKTDV